MSQTIFGSLPGAEVDGTKDDLEEEEIRPLIYTGDSELRKGIMEGFVQGLHVCGGPPHGQLRPQLRLP